VKPRPYDDDQVTLVNASLRLVLSAANTLSLTPTVVRSIARAIGKTDEGMIEILLWNAGAALHRSDVWRERKESARYSPLIAEARADACATEALIFALASQRLEEEDHA
jgi:hypothetical protein